MVHVRRPPPQVVHVEVDVSARPGLADQGHPERPGPAKLVTGTVGPSSIIRFSKTKVIWKYRNYVYTDHISALADIKVTHVRYTDVLGMTHARSHRNSER
jgi:hypothetical protein